MSSTNQILDKARALTNKDDRKPDRERGRKKKKRRGTWSTFCDPLVDPTGTIGITINERIRGKPEYSISFMQFDELGASRYIHLPIDGDHALEDVVYSLTKEAKKVIEKRKKELGHDLPDRTTDSRKSKKPRHPAKPRGPGGLSTLARQDAAGKSEPFQGKTARKKKKGKR